MTAGQRPNLQQLSSQVFDLLIVGGGINGAGVARDAALRGLKVALIEKHDFAFGSSSRSTKLAHGGLRYLETYEFSLVHESLRERGILLKKLAPHLVKPMPFWVPFYKGDQRPPWFLKAGLWLYDLLALGSLIEPHRSFSRAKALALEPNLEPQGFKGAAQYWDCQMNDARLVLENILSAQAHGALCLNYTSLLSAQRLADGEVRVKARDEESGLEAMLQAKLLINAAGPWVDEVLGSLGRSLPSPALKPTKGVHLITKPLTQGHALLIPARGDGRVFFVIPCRYGGRQASLVGTTDTDYHGNLDHVRGEAQDLDYLLTQTARVLPGAHLKKEDDWATYAGLRPLSAPLATAAGNSKISRESQILESDGLLSLTGGKYTTYRALAEETVDRAALKLGLKLKASRSAKLPLPGAARTSAGVDELRPEGLESFAKLHQISGETAEYLASIYGVRMEAVLEEALEDPSLKELVAPGCPAIFAQALFAAKHEQARRLSDFYLRRTFLGLDLDPGHASLERVAALMGGILGWDAPRQAAEIEDLKRLIAAEYRA
jgi:glycerol-3-phosphate dehydrogenase